MPFMGTGVLCSAFGSKVEFIDKMDPAQTGFIIDSVEDLDRLRMPEAGKDGLMPHVLQFIRYFKENSSIPVGITDCQGPMYRRESGSGCQTTTPSSCPRRCMRSS